MLTLVCSLMFLLFTASSAYDSPELIPQGGYYNSDGQYVRQDFDQTRLIKCDIQLIQALAKSQTSNWVVSTSSIKTILSMIYEGAGGKSESELANLLGLPHDKNEGLRQIHALQKELHSPTGRSINWKMANRVLVSEKAPVLQDFKNAMSLKFKAQVDNFNFTSPPRTANEINSWVNRSTDGFIPELVKPDAIDQRTIMVLLNAVYFKSDWRSAFDETINGCFYVIPGQCKMVPTMIQSKNFKYGFHKKLYAHVVELPYSDSRFSMVLVIPSAAGGLPEIMRDLSNASLLEFINELESSDGTLLLPRFSISYAIELSKIISSLGAAHMFSIAANLKNMVDNAARVDAFYHKAKIIVNEKGTEAKAASAANVVGILSDRPFVVNANQPLLFFIRDIKTGFLFAGQLVDPTAE